MFWNNSKTSREYRFGLHGSSSLIIFQFLLLIKLDELYIANITIWNWIKWLEFEFNIFLDNCFEIIPRLLGNTDLVSMVINYWLIISQFPLFKMLDELYKANILIWNWIKWLSFEFDILWDLCFEIIQRLLANTDLVFMEIIHWLFLSFFFKMLDELYI